jgi:phage shock protein PspC (stress-responsive transcriptional regulator)
MNKTVNINLGGVFFHIDEDAYQKLSRYFDAIKRSLSNTSGQDEIIKDIEMRISELLSEKQKTDKHVVTIKEVDEVIEIMGQPEDYIIEEENNAKNYSNESIKNSKKLYRDKEKGLIGGVATGLGHYFRIDAIWIKIIFLLFIIVGYGTGILAYIILWIVMPEAKTTSEKLEMTGEPVTISSIEKKVREEFDIVSDKLKNADYDKMGNEVKTVAQKTGNSLGDFIISILRAFSKILGVFIIIIGLSILASLLIGVFTLGSSSFIDLPWQDFIEAGNFTNYPVWTFGLLMFFAVGIPFFFLTLLGFKLLSPNIKSIGNSIKYTLLALWIIAVALAISIGINQVNAFAVDGRVVQKEPINLNSTDTLYIKFKHNDYYAKSIDEHDDFKITLDSTGNDVIYSNNIRFKIAKTDSKLSYIQIEKEAKGKTLFEAKQRAENIKYGYKIIGNQIIFDNYLLTDLKEKFRDQEIEITLYLTKGTLFKADSSIQDYDNSDDGYFNSDYDSNEYLYKVNDNQVKCLDCPEDLTDYNEIDTIQENDSTVTTTVTVNEKGVTVNKTSTKNGLSVDENGVIIKAN